jgi:hypothetical protein
MHPSTIELLEYAASLRPKREDPPLYIRPEDQSPSPNVSTRLYRRTTPRNYDGMTLPGIHTRNVMANVFTYMERRVDRCRKREHRKEIERSGCGVDPITRAEWFAAAGERVGPLTNPTNFFDGILTVKVKSHMIYCMLCNYEKDRLLEILKPKLIRLKDIRFKLDENS